MHRSRKHGILVLVVAAITACNSPLWRFDRFVVEGQMQGSRCSLAIDGKPVPRDTIVTDDHVHIRIDAMNNIGLAPGLGLKTIVCNGLQLSIAAPEKALPPTGTFPVAHGPRFSTDSFRTALFSPVVKAGAWPGALTGVFLRGYDGTVTLDSVSASQAWAHFRFRARRQARGE